MKANRIIIKPIPGCLMKLISDQLQLIDSNGNVFELKKNNVVQIMDIEDVSSPIKFDFTTKFITNWKITLLSDNRKFTLTSYNTSQTASIYEVFELLTEENSNNIH